MVDGLDVTTEVSGFVYIAVIVAMPTLWPVTSPVELTEAIVLLLEFHVTCGELVKFSWSPVLPCVPMAIS